MLKVHILQFLSTAIFKFASAFTFLIKTISKENQAEPLCTDTLKHGTADQVISDSVQSFHKLQGRTSALKIHSESQQNWHLSDYIGDTVPPLSLGTVSP